MCIILKFSLIDSYCWFHLFSNYLYLVALLNLKVSYVFMFCSHEGQAENYLYVFPYDLNTRLTFIVSFLWSFVCVHFHVYNMVAKFYCHDYIFHAHILSSYDPSSQMLTYMIKIV
jgi:hypothetical protein